MPFPLPLDHTTGEANSMSAATNSTEPFTPEGVAPAAWKAVCNRIHVRRRAKERYGLDWSQRDVRALEERIQAGCPDCVPLRPTLRHPERTLYAARCDDQWLPVVYDGQARTLVSVLPPHSLNAYRDSLAAAEADEAETTADPREVGTVFYRPDPEQSAAFAAARRAARRFRGKAARPATPAAHVPVAAGGLPLPPPEPRITDRPIPETEAERDAWVAEEQAEAVARMGEFTAEIRELSSGPGSIEIHDRIVGLSAAREAWRLHKHRILLEVHRRIAGIEDASDPVELLRAASFTISRLAKQLDYRWSPQDQVVKWLVLEFLNPNRSPSRPRSES